MSGNIARRLARLEGDTAATGTFSDVFLLLLKIMNRPCVGPDHEAMRDADAIALLGTLGQRHLSGHYDLGTRSGAGRRIPNTASVGGWTRARRMS
jgi:hypothetical protein